MGSSSQPALSATASALAALAAELWQRSGGEQFGLTVADCLRLLDAIARKYLPPGAGDRELRELARSLKAEELALTQACAAGHQRAWEIFLLRYREKLMTWRFPSLERNPAAASWRTASTLTFTARPRAMVSAFRSSPRTPGAA